MKTKIAALLTALVIIFIGAGGVYYISQTSPQVSGVKDSTDQTGDELPENQSVRYIENFVDTRVEDWLKYIGREFGLDTMNIADGSFIWTTEVGDEEILGQTIILDGSLDVSKETIVDLFEQSGYTENEFGGYTKEDLACLIKYPENEEETVTEIRCGLFVPEKIIIKKLLLEKYPQKKATDMLVDIVQSTPDHMSGNVQYVEPAAEPTDAVADEEPSAPVESGVQTFLAAKDADGEWVLVFEGNEKLLCSEIEPYNFPTEMVPECFDDTLNEMVERTSSEAPAEEPAETY